MTTKEIPGSPKGKKRRSTLLISYGFVVFNYVVDLLNGIIFHLTGLYVGKARVLGFLFGVKRVSWRFFVYSFLLLSAFFLHFVSYADVVFSMYVRVIWDLFLIEFFLNIKFDRDAALFSARLYLVSIALYSLIVGFGADQAIALIFTAKNDYSPFLTLIFFYLLFVKFDLLTFLLAIFAALALNSKFVYLLFALLLCVYVAQNIGKFRKTKRKSFALGKLFVAAIVLGLVVFSFEAIILNRYDYYAGMYAGLGLDFLFTGRITMLNYVTRTIKDNFSVMRLLIGGGFRGANSTGYFTATGLPVGCELDLVDAFYDLGLLGVSYFVIYFKGILKYSRKSAPFVIVLLHSLLGGHVIFTPVSTFLVLITLTLINNDSLVRWTAAKSFS